MKKTNYIYAVLAICLGGSVQAMEHKEEQKDHKPTAIASTVVMHRRSTKQVDSQAAAKAVTRKHSRSQLKKNVAAEAVLEQRMGDEIAKHSELLALRAQNRKKIEDRAAALAAQQQKQTKSCWSRFACKS